MTQIPASSRAAVRRARAQAPAERSSQVGRWELVELAAEGTLSQVFRARPVNHPSCRSAAYALKMLRPEWRDEPRAVQFLLREAIVGRSVSHPHVVSILEASVSRPPRFLVMPWLDGRTLAAQLARGRRVDLPGALWVARQVAEALQALHAAGWIHGDVKPSNIFVATGGHVTLLDLGFARPRDEIGSVVERCVLGTWNYLAPEWITSALRADIRSDVYSLGCVLFELLTGRLPFSGNDLAELAGLHKSAVPPDLRCLAPHLSGGVAELVRDMIAKEPLRRPQTPRELVERLTALEIDTFSERALG